MFIEKVQELVAEQKQEVERAVVNRGKWRLMNDNIAKYCITGNVNEKVMLTNLTKSNRLLSLLLFIEMITLYSIPE